MDTIIQIKDLGKTFTGKDNTVEALKNINLDIHKGEIYGIIGMSGAGKSTLVRCLNFLERPTTGTVFVEGQDLSLMKDAALRKTRTQISMIFQHFNLADSKTVYKNISFVLEAAGYEKDKIHSRVTELLDFVNAGGSNITTSNFSPSASSFGNNSNTSSH